MPPKKPLPKFAFSRETLHSNVTAHPTPVRVVQQLRETFPGDACVRYLLHDNDSILSDRVGKAISRVGVEPKIFSELMREHYGTTAARMAESGLIGAPRKNATTMR